MKGKKPTYNQRKFIQAHRLNASNWLVQKDTPEIMQLVYRHDDKKIRIIKKNKGA